MDICRELPCCLKCFCKADITLHDKAFVKLYQIGYPLVDQKIITYRDLRSATSCPEEAEVEERSIEHNITMVAYICISHIRMRVFQTTLCNARGGFLA